MKNLLYLAGPYTHKVPEVQELRYKLHCQVALCLMKAKHNVYSPIAHGHSLEINTPGIRLPYEMWLAHGISFLKEAKEMLIIDIPGTCESKGVSLEIAYAEMNNIPFSYIDENGILNYHLYQNVDPEIIKKLKEYE